MKPSKSMLDKKGDDRRGDDRDDNEIMFKRLSESICGLTCVLQKLLEQRNRELVTKRDLDDAKRDIIKSVESAATIEDQRLLDGLSQRSEQLAKKLEALDARTNL